jgi:hypothetical protein
MRHYEGMVRVIQEFERRGVTVLSPKASTIVNPGKPFALLRTDKSGNRRVVEQGHLNAIDRAAALYVYNPEGHIGESAGYEIAWACKAGTPIFVKEKLGPDSIYRFHAHAKKASINDIARFLRRAKLTA